MRDVRSQPIPVGWVTGLPHVGKSKLIEGWLVDKPKHERWAWLGAHPWAAGLVPEARGPSDSGAGLVSFSLSESCACCAGRSTAAQVLGRLLRAGPWDQVLLETRIQEHALGFIDVLQSGVFERFFRLLPPVLVWNGPLEAAVFQSSWMQVYGEVAPILARHQAAGAVFRAEDCEWDSLGLDLAMSRRILPVVDGRLSWNSLNQVWAELDVGGGASYAAWPCADEWVSLWRWPAVQRFDRRKLAAALAGLMQNRDMNRRLGVRDWVGRFRTARAWYAWRGTDQKISIQESAWRVDNRLALLAKRPLDPHVIEVALQPALEVPGAVAVVID